MYMKRLAAVAAIAASLTVLCAGCSSQPTAEDIAKEPTPASQGVSKAEYFAKMHEMMASHGGGAPGAPKPNAPAAPPAPAQ